MKDDTISRKAAIDALEQAKEQYFDRRVIIGKMQNVISNLPSAQPERKRGKWKPYRCDMYECSECGYIYTELTDRHRCGANFCPHCGADTREDSHETD